MATCESRESEGTAADAVVKQRFEQIAVAQQSRAGAKILGAAGQKLL